MMKILDKYLAKQFINSIFFSLLVFSAIFIVIDLMEKMDNFIDHNVPMNIVAQYYLYFIPDIIRLMIPVAILLACLFTVGKMSSSNELAAIKASGISMYRFMLPFLIITFIASIFSIYFGGYVVPLANKEKIYIERVYFKKNTFRTDNNIYFQDNNTRIVTINFYNVKTNLANRVSIQEFDSLNQTKMNSRLDIKRMKYDSLSTNWIAFDVVERKFNNGSESFRMLDSLEIDFLSFKPEDIIRKQQKPAELTLAELKKFSQDLINSGNNPKRVLIEYHSRYAFAFASFIVVLFGLPLSANKRRGGLAIQIGINLAVTFSYLVFMKISQAMGTNESLSPIITAWFANIIFFIGGVINILRVKQ